MSLLSKANALFKQGKLDEAASLYERFTVENPNLAEIVKYNLKLCRGLVKSKIEPASLNLPAKNNISIDIILPVYNALEDTAACIDSLYSTKTIDFNLIVIDDCSDCSTEKYLIDQSQKKNFLLIRNQENLRFTKNVNKGFHLSTSDLVVLLNSDTIVTTGWLEGLIDCFNSNENIGIVGPLSNAASWQSIPERIDSETGDWSVNELSNRTTVENIGRLVKLVSKNVYPIVPSVNGFCYAIKREVLDTIGCLDEKTFPTGYGEEDDFTIRARRAGFLCSIADDVYVYHAKSKSYTKEVRKELVLGGKSGLVAKYGKEFLTALNMEWRNEKVLPSVANSVASFLKFSDGKDKVLYTAIFGDYEELKDPQNVCEDWDYVCYTDNPNIRSKVFDVRYVPPVFDNPTKNARMFKILADLFLIGYQYSLWVDGSVKIRGKPVDELIVALGKETDFALHPHSHRDGIIDEANACIKLGKDSEKIIRAQLEKYLLLGVPEDEPVYETGQILRRHTNLVRQVNRYWWDEVTNYSIRDQISFSYCCWKFKLTPKHLEGSAWLDQYFQLIPHGFNVKYRNLGKISLIVQSTEVNMLLSNLSCILDSLRELQKQGTEISFWCNQAFIENVMTFLQENELSDIKVLGIDKSINIKVQSSDYVLFINSNVRMLISEWLMGVLAALKKGADIVGGIELDEKYRVICSGFRANESSGFSKKIVKYIGYERVPLLNAGVLFMMHKDFSQIDLSKSITSEKILKLFGNRNTQMVAPYISFTSR